VHLLNSRYNLHPLGPHKSVGRKSTCLSFSSPSIKQGNCTELNYGCAMYFCDSFTIAVLASSISFFRGFISHYHSVTTTLFLLITIFPISANTNSRSSKSICRGIFYICSDNNQIIQTYISLSSATPFHSDLSQQYPFYKR
jgi:hypothetical protein